MPLFEYSCADCGTEFEKIVPSYKSEVECKHCASPRVEKKLSVFAVAGERNEPSFSGGCGRCGADAPGMCNMN